MIPVNYKDCFQHVSDILLSGSIPMLYGPPGSAKSAMAADIAENFNLKLIDLRLSDYEPPDINGFMRHNAEKDRGEYVPMELIPIEGDPLPVSNDGHEYAGWLLFFDEITNADEAVLKVVYKVLQDRLVAGMRKIHDNVVMMAAGNGSDDGSLANTMPTTLQSRMMSLRLQVSANEWILYESANQGAPNVLAYLATNPEDIHQLSMASYNDVNFPCHRNWSRLSRYLKQINQLEEVSEKYMAPIAGAIGQPTAAKFISFSQVYRDLPDPKTMFQDPLNVRIPSDNWGLCTIIVNSIVSNVTDKTVTQAVTLLKRFDGAHQALGMRSMIARHPTFIDHPAVESWIQNEGTYLVI